LQNVPDLSRRLTEENDRFFIGDLAIIFLAPYPFSTLRPLIKILSSVGILLICFSAHGRHSLRKRRARDNKKFDNYCKNWAKRTSWQLSLFWHYVQKLLTCYINLSTFANNIGTIKYG